MLDQFSFHGYTPPLRLCPIGTVFTHRYSAGAAGASAKMRDSIAQSRFAFPYSCFLMHRKGCLCFCHDGCNNLRNDGLRATSAVAVPTVFRLRSGIECVRGWKYWKTD